MIRTQRRLRRERRTVEAMVRIHCAGRHGQGELCDDCRELLDYALERIDRCPWGADKPACAHCAIHCYKVEPRARIRDVMRFAGPRMMFRHPILAAFHIFDGHRPADLESLRAARKATGEPTETS